jgi:hypothetical protein
MMKTDTTIIYNKLDNRIKNRGIKWLFLELLLLLYSSFS